MPMKANSKITNNQCETTVRAISERALITYSRLIFSGKKIGILMVAVLLIASGCASTPSSIDPRATDKLNQHSAMVSNILSVVPQLLEPLATTIQFNETESGEVSGVVAQLLDLGYGLQRVDSDQGKYFLRLEHEQIDSDNSQKETQVRLTLGNIELTRTYRLIERSDKFDSNVDIDWDGNSAIIATSPLLVSGTRKEIKMSGVEIAKTPTNAKILFKESTVQYTKQAPIEGGIPTITLITPSLIQNVVLSSVGSPIASTLYASTFELGNMAHVEDGAFASISDSYDVIGRETVIFPNDSQNLGRSGKRLIKKVIERFSSNTDLVGLVGCSNGPTSLKIGNEGLALGRAKRIAEEFYAAGVSREQVFNEGCWSGDVEQGSFPNRGVVIDLWRRKG